MKVLSLDKPLIDKLAHLRETTEIHDESGTLVGTFTPTVPSSELDNQKVPQHLLDKIDDAELDRRCRSKELGRTTAEVLERLRVLEQQLERQDS